MGRRPGVGQGKYPLGSISSPNTVCGAAGMWMLAVSVRVIGRPSV
jgi:hypothetical protein